MKAVAEGGHAWLPVPAVVCDEVCAQFKLKRVGDTEEVQERYYAISAERKLKHPAVVTITDAVKRNLFHQSNNGR
jgi:LysR family transcriptional regulator, transcriptional activator of nhaA